MKIVHNHKRAEEAPAETKEEFIGLLDASFEGLFFHGEGIILDANPAMARLFGVHHSDIISRHIQEFITPEYRNMVLEKMLCGYEKPYEAIGLRKDGSIFPIEIQTKVVPYQGYDFRVVAIRDISELKQAAKARRQYTRELILLNNISDLLQACHIEEETYSIVSSMGKLLFPKDSGSLYLLDKSHTRLSMVTSWGNSPPEPFMFDRDECQALRYGRVHVISHPDAEPQCQHFSLPPNNGYLCAPIIASGEILGILSLCFGQSPPRQSDDDFRRILYSKRMLANRVAVHYALSLVSLRLRENLRFEHQRSEELLLNILPKPIANRLKQGQNIIADSFAEVSILFADLVNFTRLAAQVTPTTLVTLLNEIFSMFDRLAQHHGLEKIKTIGDAYMVVGGLPTPRPDHAEAIAEMALDMQKELTRFNGQHGKSLGMRIGINIGPVIAGVIGTKKYIYDLWGDAVNIASHMESHGIADSIQVTEETYKRLQEKYLFEQRGMIQVKGKGNMMTYLLIDRKNP